MNGTEYSVDTAVLTAHDNPQLDALSENDATSVF